MADDDGFLSRWSRRKVQARQPEPPAVPLAPATVAASMLAPAPAAAVATAAGEPASPQSGAAMAPPAGADDVRPRALPTLDDVATLTHESDFARFVAPEVSGDVRNAALKKLFSDPHFNVMDGLDTYIDDYNTPDPLPPSVLRQMAQAAYLGLVEPEKSPAPAPDNTPNECAAGQASAALCPAAAPEAAESKTHDEDPDLQLQSLHDPGPPGPEPRAGGNAGRQR